MTDLESWFKERPLWLQDAARRLIQNTTILPSDLDELVKLCKDEAAGIAKPDNSSGQGLTSQYHLDVLDKQTLVRLDAIEDVSGVNALAPRRPLEFGSEPLVIIFGPNGSGKSGYMRLMKHICGARAAGQLYGDVYATAPQDQSCLVRYTRGTEKRQVRWTPATGMVLDLHSVSIYDTGCAHVYVDDKHEVSYEPPVLGLLRRLVTICGDVDRALQKEAESKTSALAKWPVEYADTDSQKWYSGITHSTSAKDIETRCFWTAEDDKTLTTLNQRLAETDPAARAQALRNIKTHLSKLVTLIETIEAQVSDEAFTADLKARKDAATKRRAASEDAQRVFSAAPLEGVASESWRLLWEKARTYSEQTAYPATPFPNTASGARCVLCQQTLEDDAKNRLEGFEAYVQGALEREAAAAEKKHRELGEMRVAIPDDAELKAKLDLAGVADETARSLIEARFSAMRSRQQRFLDGEDVDTLPPLPVQIAAVQLTKWETQLESQATAFEEDAASSDLGQARKQKRELEARKWLGTQKSTIEAEIIRLGYIYLLDRARRLTNTKAISSEASHLSELLVTDAFKQRFEQELTALGASSLRVCLEKTGTSKGQVWHELKLRQAQRTAPTRDILSEGEFRIVSIALFLADVTANHGSTAFIFDDPISSLDQSFEEKVAERLTALAGSRQVIVLTHRLSLMSSLEEAADKAGMASRIIALERQPWGTGDPANVPLQAQKPAKALNTLLHEQLHKAKKVYEENGWDEYSPLAKALCSNTRITVERLIEYDLLADVVQRFRRPIHTVGKLAKVARVTSKDCRFLDSMMTKYSHYEHSQPQEAPVALPEPDELAADLQGLIDWLNKFSSREVPQP